jgi:hypothetical protein
LTEVDPENGGQVVVSGLEQQMTGMSDGTYTYTPLACLDGTTLPRRPGRYLNGRIFASNHTGEILYELKEQAA